MKLIEGKATMIFFSNHKVIQRMIVKTVFLLLKTRKILVKMVRGWILRELYILKVNDWHK